MLKQNPKKTIVNVNQRLIKTKKNLESLAFPPSKH